MVALGAEHLDARRRVQPPPFARGRHRHDAGHVALDEAGEVPHRLAGSHHPDHGDAEMPVVGCAYALLGPAGLADGERVAPAVLPMPLREADRPPGPGSGPRLLPVPVAVHRSGDAVVEHLFGNPRPPRLPGARIGRHLVLRPVPLLPQRRQGRRRRLLSRLAVGGDGVADGLHRPVVGEPPRPEGAGDQLLGRRRLGFEGVAERLHRPPLRRLVAPTHPQRPPMPAAPGSSPTASRTAERTWRSAPL